MDKRQWELANRSSRFGVRIGVKVAGWGAADGRTRRNDTVDSHVALV